MSAFHHWVTCRCCGESQSSDGMVKYAVRHYAHPRCALEKWGASFFDRLSAWQLSKFPAMTAAKFGLFDELGRRIEANASRVSAQT